MLHFIGSNLIKYNMRQICRYFVFYGFLEFQINMRNKESFKVFRIFRIIRNIAIQHTTILSKMAKSIFILTLRCRLFPIVLLQICAQDVIYGFLGMLGMSNLATILVTTSLQGIQMLGAAHGRGMRLARNMTVNQQIQSQW